MAKCERGHDLIRPGTCYECGKGASSPDLDEKWRQKQQYVDEKSRRKHELQQEKERSKREVFQTRINDIKQFMINRLSSGKAVSLHCTRYLPVDSILLEEPQFSQNFSVDPLVLLGLNGWEVVGTVPKTLGIGLKNTEISMGSTIGGGTTWGAGIGGNVIGIYVVLRKALTVESVEDDDVTDWIVDQLSVGTIR